MTETVEKSIKLVFGTEVRNVTKNQIFGYALEKNWELELGLGVRSVLCLGRSVWWNFENADRARLLEDIVTFLIGRLHKKHVLYVEVLYNNVYPRVEEYHLKRIWIWLVRRVRKQYAITVLSNVLRYPKENYSQGASQAFSVRLSAMSSTNIKMVRELVDWSWLLKKGTRRMPCSSVTSCAKISQWLVGVPEMYPLQYCRASLTKNKLRLLRRDHSGNPKSSASDFPV